MPIDYQLMLQIAYEMPRQRLADLQATFELMEATGAMRSKGLSKRCKASNTDDRPVSTDSPDDARRRSQSTQGFQEDHPHKLCKQETRADHQTVRSSGSPYQ